MYRSEDSILKFFKANIVGKGLLEPDLQLESLDFSPVVGGVILMWKNLKEDESDRRKGDEKDVEIRRIKEVEAAKCAKTKLMSEADQTRLDEEFLDKYVGETAGKDFNSPGIAFLSKVRGQKEGGTSILNFGAISHIVWVRSLEQA